ncbi:hypothetical protein BDN72DRAFT_903354 [Pluteus cervinus]|uniref:Uncharacterized protein n=1 Tax=Pluteus cervinus TaxID=181527 RepID=A0ACD3A9L4_9AGAR|nr:hypothetical protein BDN72DRAFT_903354 [Pluteus cervinus]
MSQHIHTLDQALTWCPPQILSKDPISTETRAPSHIDLHLADNLILKRIIVDDSLLTECVKKADSTLASHGGQPILIPTGSLAIPPSELVTIAYECELEEHYRKHLLPFIGTLASATSSGSFNNKDPNWKKFNWRRQVAPANSGKKSPSRADADGYLHCAGQLTHFENFLVWEFKRPGIVTPLLTQRIADIAQNGAFAWCRCALINSSEAKSGICNLGKHYNKAGDYLFTNRRMSPDFTDAPAATDTPQRFRPIRTKAASTATVDDKAHHILQQLWINSVMEDPPT